MKRKRSRKFRDGPIHLGYTLRVLSCRFPKTPLLCLFTIVASKACGEAQTYQCVFEGDNLDGYANAVPWSGSARFGGTFVSINRGCQYKVAFDPPTAMTWLHLSPEDRGSPGPRPPTDCILTNIHYAADPNLNTIGRGATISYIIPSVGPPHIMATAIRRLSSPSPYTSTLNRTAVTC
jgi:hypothetical protein